VRPGRGPGADRGGVAEADRAEVARHQDGLLAGGLEVAPEAVGVVADVDADDRVVGDGRFIASKTAIEETPLPRSSARRLVLLLAPDRQRSATSGGGRSTSGCPSAGEHGRAVTPISPQTGTSTRGSARAAAVESTWIVGFLGVMPVWLLKRGAEDEEHVALVHEPGGDRRARSAEHAAAERVAAAGS
jgi:hypothetical protein